MNNLPSEERRFKLTVITIARQFGSGGEEIARKVAQSLEYDCIDKELIVAVAQEARVDEAAVHRCDERGRHPITHFLMNSLIGERHLIPGWGMEYAWSDEIEVDAVKDGICPLSRQSSRVFFESVIKKLGKRGKVVIVGRGAGIVLARQTQLLSVGIIAPEEYRLQQVMRERDLGRGEALALIEQIDAQRARYIKQNYDVQWDDPRLYHLVLDTGRISPETASLIISQAALGFDKTTAIGG